jgi:hypothetical protein
MHMPGSYDKWKLATPPEYEFLGPDPAEEEEFPEPVIDEEWNASRGEHETVVTFGSGAKYALRQNGADEWEIHGPDSFYINFTSEKHALTWLIDIEHWGW